MTPRLFAQIARVSAAILVAAVVFAPGVGLAEAEWRPYDAPRVQPDQRRVKPLPAEYITEDAGWILLAYHPSARERVRPLIAQAERIREELVRQLGTGVLARVEVRVAAVPGEMPRLAPSEQVLGHAAAFSAMNLKQDGGELSGGLVVLSLTSPSSLETPDLTAALRHALAHLAFDEALAGRDVPAWLHEGYATHCARAGSAYRIQALALASLQKRALGVRELKDSFAQNAPPSPLAVAQAADFVRFLTAETNRDQFAALVQKVREGERFEEALNHAYGADLATIGLAWQKDMAKRYSFLPILMGTVLTWALIAVAIVLRRMRKRTARRPLFSRHSRVRENHMPSRLAAVPAATLGRRGAREELKEVDVFDEPVPPDAEVPKVEHDGRWHTLH